MASAVENVSVDVDNASPANPMNSENSSVDPVLAAQEFTYLLEKSQQLFAGLR